MKPLENSKIYKGMIFAGCSFTWGQGLYYYSNLPTLKEPPPDQYFDKLVTFSQKEFIKSRRYPRLVANHFNTFELVHPKNGGSNEGAIRWWRNSFSHEHTQIDSDPCPILYSEEISHCIFQLTQWNRDHFMIDHNGENLSMNWMMLQDSTNRLKFSQWLGRQGLTLEEFEYKHKADGFSKIKEFLFDLEQCGIKTYILPWMDEWDSFIDNDSFMKDRLIPLHYNGSVYRNIYSMMSHSFYSLASYNKELTIKSDFESFLETPKDHHPSLKCHQALAHSIIKHIETHECT